MKKEFAFLQSPVTMVHMTFEQHCNDFARYGAAAQEAAEYELNARYDSVTERYTREGDADFARDEFAGEIKEPAQVSSIVETVSFDECDEIPF